VIVLGLRAVKCVWFLASLCVNTDMLNACAVNGFHYTRVIWNYVQLYVSYVIVNVIRVSGGYYWLEESAALEYVF
jgi:hypothetical protein